MLRPRHLAAVLVVALALTACGSDEPEPSASGSPGGEITVYSGRSEELVGPLFEKFEQATGIKVNARFGDTAELATQILDEGDASPADVFFGQDAGALGALQADDRLIVLNESIVNMVDERLRSKDGKWIGASGRVRVLVYNTEQVNEADLPKSVKDLTGEAWKDKVGWAPTNGSFQAFVTAFRELEGEEAARSWLTEMKDNGAKVFENNDSIVEAVIQGEIPVGLVNHYYPFKFTKDDPDAPVGTHYFGNGDVGGLINVAGAGVIKTTKKQEAASRFIEYLVSDEAQRYFVEQTNEYPVVEGVDAPKLQDLKKLEAPAIDLSDLADLKGTLELLQDVGLV